MERNTDRRLLLLACALVAIGAAVIAIEHRCAPERGSFGNRDPEAVERRLAGESHRIGEEIRDAGAAADSLAARERDALEGHRSLADEARDLADGLGTLGEDTGGIGSSLARLEAVLAELRKRSEKEAAETLP